MLQDPTRGVQTLTLRLQIEKRYISSSWRHSNTAERVVTGMPVDSPVDELLSPNDNNISHVILNRVVSDVVVGRVDGLVLLPTKGSVILITSINTSKPSCGHTFG
jgi:hypothetical protein